MLILLPPSRSMASVDRGKPVDTAALSFPGLTPTRIAVLSALVDVSSKPDATRMLGEPPSMGRVVHRNVALPRAPTAAAESIYSGVLYDALALHDLPSAARRRARAWIVIISALWGAVRLSDRIPSYRLGMCGRLPGLPHLTGLWQEPLEGVLPGAARRGLVVDCRSAEYATAWRPRADLAERTVTIKIIRERNGLRSAVSHGAKHTRGLVARQIVTHAIDPRRPAGLAEALSEHFEVDLIAPSRDGRTWELQVVEPRPSVRHQPK